MIGQIRKYDKHDIDQKQTFSLKLVTSVKR